MSPSLALALTLTTLAAQPPLTVLVADFQAPGLEARQLVILQQSLRAEVDKLEGVITSTSADVSTRGAAVESCPTAEATCLIRLAESLGVDEVLLPQATTLAVTKVLTLKRVRIRDAEITGAVTRQMTGGRGEEFLLILGEAVAELFPELALKPGAIRGVTRAVATEWTRPPLSPWVLAGSAVVTATALGTAVALGIATNRAKDDYNRYARQGIDNPAGISGEHLRSLSDDVHTKSTATNVAWGATGLFAAATGVVFFFIDWHTDKELTAAVSPGAATLFLGGHF